MMGRVLCVALASFLSIVLANGAGAQITIVHTPYYEYVPDPVNPYEIRATITSTAGSIIVTRVWYSAGGTWQQLFMQPTAAADEYVAYIPAKPVLSRIFYYLRVGDSAGNILNDPPGAPGAGATAHFFRIGHFVPLYSEDFEAGYGGWISGMTAGEDDWMFGPPNVGGQNPNDPLTAYSGQNVWGNDLMGTTPQEGDYSNNVANYIDSPSLDFTGRSDIWMFYRRWLTVETTTYDKARIEVSGTEVWRNPPGNTLDVEWAPQDVYLSPTADNNPATVIRFALESDSTIVYGGWNFDNVDVRAKAPEVQMSVSDTTPSPGQVFTLDVQADPTSPWYLLAAKRQGQGFFQVPSGGPVVWTGLHPNSQKQYFSGMTDGSGHGTLVKTIPNRADLIGKKRRLAVVAPTLSDFSVSPSILITFE